MVSPKTLITTARVIYGLRKRLNTNHGILVYQMGKVASKSIRSTISDALPSTPIIHVHTLNPTIARDNFRKYKFSSNGKFLKYSRSLFLSSEVSPSLIYDKNWKIITLVRDPVAQTISDFFFSLGDYTDFNGKKYQLQESDINRLKEIYLNDYPDHSLPIEWFDDELSSVFNYDIYAKLFDRRKGYFYDDNLLLLRVEDLNTIGPEALESFLNVNNVMLKRVNTANTLGYKKTYEQFKSHISLPMPFLQDMYDNKYARHFYTSAEIETFILKWQNPTRTDLKTGLSRS